MAKRLGLSRSAWRRFAPGGSHRDTAARQGAEQDGRKAEGSAAWWLRLKGYRILDQRVRTPVGEIDLIAARGGITCFIEVKHRTTPDAAIRAVTPTQCRRIEKAAAWWTAQPGRAYPDAIRFDVIAIVPGRRPYHLIDAWRPEPER